MAEVFNITHEIGDLSEYTATATDGGDLSVENGAALVGSYGMQAVIDDTNGMFGEKEYTQISSGVYGWRFYIDPNGLSMDDNDAFYVCRITRQDTSGRADVQLRYDSGYEILARVREDDGSYRSTGNYPITDDAHYVECLVEYASGPSGNDGTLMLWIDGVQKESITDVDLDGRSQPDEAFLGPHSSIDATINGTFYLDDFVLRDDDTRIGSASASVSVSTLTLASSTQALSVSPGAASINANTLTLAGSTPALNVVSGLVVALNALTLTSSAETLAVAPGATSALVNTLTVASSTPAISVSIVLAQIISVNTLTLTSSPESFSPPIPNFPGAQGAGAYTIGGREGSVLFVDNLNNSGSGSLRAALEASGPRIIVPRVAGTIELTSFIEIDSPYCTFAGQAAFRAGGEGITVKDAGIVVRTHDVVIRYLRVRGGPFLTDLYGGPFSHTTYTPMEIYSNNSSADRRVYNNIVDHCSFSWGIDTNFGTFMPASLPYDSGRLTVQWCIFAEALYYDSEYNSKNVLLGASAGSTTKNMSIHHNLFANSTRRNPAIDMNAEIIELANNLMYNINGTTTFIQDSGAFLNYIGNAFEQGSLTTTSNFIIIGPADPPTTGECQIYVSGNIGGHRTSESDPEWDVVSDDYGSGNPASTGYQTLTPHSLPGEAITIHDLEEARALILADAGASLARDSHDTDTIADVDAETGAIIQWDGLTDGIDPSGSWPALDNFTSPTDTDDDGIPDDWENSRGLDYQVADDDGYDLHDLYTNIEVYLMGLTGSPTVALDTITLAGSAETSNPTLGIIGMETLSLAGSAETMTSVATDQAVAINEITLAASPENISALPGAAVVATNTLTLASNTEAISVIPGTVAIYIGTLALTGSAEPLTVPGVTIIPVGTLVLSGSAEALSVIPGGVSTPITALELTASAVPISATPGAVVVAANSLALAGSVEAISIQTQIIIQMIAIILASSAPATSLISVELYNETGMADLILNASGLDSVFTFIEDIDILTGDDQVAIVAPTEAFEVLTGNDSMIIRTAK